MPMPPCSPRAAAVLACALASLVFAAPAAALTTRCVGTSQELADALADAGDAAADPLFVIKVREGTYTSTTPAPFELVLQRWEQLVEISGGWTGEGGSCDHKSFDPSRTTIAGGSAKRALFFTTTQAFGQEVYLQDVRFTNPDFDEVAAAACLFGVVNMGASARIERVQFEDCRAPQGEDASAHVLNRGELTVRDVAVSSGRAASNGGLSVYTDQTGISRVAQVSVTGTQSSDADAFGSGIVLLNFDAAVTYLSNSVSWGNDVDGPDIWVHGPSIVFERVHSGSLVGVPDANIVPGSGDPGFIAPGNPRLRADSPLVDSGIAAPEGGTGTFDADGFARVHGAVVDVGAFEHDPEAPGYDLIFAHGFDPTASD